MAERTELLLTVLSLGAGVQSSVMALMADRGEFDRVPDAAIFADTGAEPESVYEHLDWLEAQLSFPVHRVNAGSSLTADVVAGLNSTGQGFVTIPAYLHRGNKWSASKRQCTREYKLEPIRREVRRLCGVGHKQRMPAKGYVEMWIGISTDEITRMKPPRDKWSEGRWPLIEIGMSRQDCKDWFAERYPDRMLHRSACTFCPYHSEAEWQAMRDEDPASWEEACLVDESLRTPQMIELMNGELYLRRRREPLRAATFAADDPAELDMFDEECEGMCGV